jgi:hypothetical protein
MTATVQVSNDYEKAERKEGSHEIKFVHIIGCDDENDVTVNKKKCGSSDSMGSPISKSGKMPSCHSLSLALENS